MQDGLKLFTPRDEIWAELDAGTQAYMDCINHPDFSLEKVLENILLVARQRLVIIQSVLLLRDHEEPPAEEIEWYKERLRDLKNAGAQISLVQIYSATRPMARRDGGHLSLLGLTRLARRVREVSGLPAEIF